MESSTPQTGTSQPDTPPAADGRLRWLLRRGMKELDVLMERYYAARFHAAPAAEKAEFLRLITLAEDPDIWAWVMGYETPPDEYLAIVEQLRIHR
ncbi:succinate dehydrogenase assembly factor 2 [Fontimonas sp. SYSU GA230001]|uniref:FAD assembly factor SdhE n=1 Tax=Fontimonas sp. SYSU GA230001 TaxID=3142450 RepID=UPI0032B4FEBD